MEHAKLLPDFSFGYNLMSMKGVGANNIDYNPCSLVSNPQIFWVFRFFRSGQKQNYCIKINEQVAANEYEVNLKKCKQIMLRYCCNTIKSSNGVVL